jgi:hypothetical protein
VAPALSFFDGSQWCFLSVCKAHVIYVYIEFSAASHSTFVLRLSYRCQREATARNYDQVFNFDILKDLEINSVACRSIRRR